MIITEKKYFRDTTSALFALKDGPIYASDTDLKVEMIKQNNSVEIVASNDRGWVYKNYKIVLTPMAYYTIKRDEIND